ncbi:MAG: cobalamin-dependent protein, partial [Planctomycetota bacterium]
MLTLINTNRMAPLIGPIGLDYVAASAEKAGIDVEVVDLGLADQPEKALKDYFSTREPELVGLSFRNADDCFWPSADWFVPGLKDTIRTIGAMTGAPIVIGGVGFS